MNERYASETTRAPRRVEREITLDTEQSYLSSQLQSIGDELTIFSEATVIDRQVKSVPLTLGEDARIPQEHALLSYSNTVLDSGAHNSKLTIPTLTLVHEGINLTNDEELGFWRTPGKYNPLSHATMLSALEPIIPSAPHLKKLFDTAEIPNRVIADALWNDFTSLSDNWRESHIYRSDDNLRVASLHPETIRNQHIDSSYAGSVESVLSVTDAPTTRLYRVRVGTTTPMIIDPTNQTYDRHSPYAHSTKPISVNKEFSFELQVLREDNTLVNSIAKLAIESADLSIDDLDKIATRSSLDLHGSGKAAQIFHRALGSVARNRLL